MVLFVEWLEFRRMLRLVMLLCLIMVTVIWWCGDCVMMEVRLLFRKNVLLIFLLGVFRTWLRCSSTGTRWVFSRCWLFFDIVLMSLLSMGMKGINESKVFSKSCRLAHRHLDDVCVVIISQLKLRFAVFDRLCGIVYFYCRDVVVCFLWIGYGDFVDCVLVF